jgi:predicted N-acetyltransferase YhbS
MSANDNHDDVDSGSEADFVIAIKLSLDRSRELKRLAEQQQMSVGDLAKSYLEAEIEAQHGLTYGPLLRRYIYRD